MIKFNKEFYKIPIKIFKVQTILKIQIRILIHYIKIHYLFRNLDWNFNTIYKNTLIFNTYINVYIKDYISMH